MKYPLSFLLLLSISFIQAQSSFNTVKMDSLLDVYATRNRMMVSVGIRSNGSMVYSKATGCSWCEEGNSAEANPSTKYRIGSITKTFTSVLILQLVEQKKLKLTTPLSKFFPKFPNAKTITIEHLLGHRSGIHNYTDDADFDSLIHLSLTRAQMMERLMKMPSDFTPGSQFSYSNTNYILLGFILEDLTHKSYSQLLNERIINPLELKNTYYGSFADIRRNEARSYRYNGVQWIFAGETDPSVAGAAGIIVSDTEDLLKFIEALFNDKLLSSATVDQMIQMRDGYGLGIFSVPFYERAGIGHNGAIDGFESSLYYFPSDKVSVALLTNGINEDVNQFLVGVLSIFFNKPYSIPQFYSIQVPEDVLDDYVGNYYCATLQLEFTVTRQGNVLIGQPTGQSAFGLDARNEKVFVYEPAGVEIEFMQDADKKSNELILRQGGATFSFKKVKE